MRLVLLGDRNLRDDPDYWTGTPLFKRVFSATRNKEKAMDDSELLHTIEKLVSEEHELMQQAGAGQLDDTKHARMHDNDERLDHCWNLLRQRRARRQLGSTPDEATVRDAGIAKRYQH